MEKLSSRTSRNDQIRLELLRGKKGGYAAFGVAYREVVRKYLSKTKLVKKRLIGIMRPLLKPQQRKAFEERVLANAATPVEHAQLMAELPTLTWTEYDLNP